MIQILSIKLEFLEFLQYALQAMLNASLTFLFLNLTGTLFDELPGVYSDSLHEMTQDELLVLPLK